MRTPVRQAGCRDYRTRYTQATLQKAVQECRTGKLSMLTASKRYHIPYGTLNNKVRGRHTKRPGAPNRLLPETEQRLVTTIEVLIEWKLPVDHVDVRLLVKDYLDRCGVQDARFKNNYPGDDSRVIWQIDVLIWCF